MLLHSENDLVELTKFRLIPAQNLLIKQTTKCLVDLTKYTVDSTKLFSCFNRVGIFSNSTKKFISINENLFDLIKRSWISNKIILLVQEKFFPACI